MAQTHKLTSTNMNPTEQLYFFGPLLLLTGFDISLSFSVCFVYSNSLAIPYFDLFGSFNLSYYHS